jgi:hypothetical protein
MLETTSQRLSRVNKGLLSSLELCEKEIRDCHSQKLAREEALRTNVVDNQDLADQISKYQELVANLLLKNTAAETRRETSQKEINRLEKVINVCTRASNDVQEIRSMMDNYRASIDHHTDIVQVASMELEVDKHQMVDLQQSIVRLNIELQKAEKSLEFPVTKQYEAEIGQLDDTIDVLTEDRAEILAVLEGLDVERLNNGKSKMLSLSAQKKRKLDSAVGFSPESRSPRPTKRNRPAELPDNTLSVRNNGELVEVGVQDNRLDQLFNTPMELPVFFSVFLPKSAQIIGNTGVSELSLFNQIEWLFPLSRVTLNQDISPSFFRSWKVMHMTENNLFALQSMSSFTEINYRIVAIDPANPQSIIERDADPEQKNPKTQVIPLAITNDTEQAKMLFNFFAKLETFEKFDYPAVWRVLCAK